MFLVPYIKWVLHFFFGGFLPDNTLNPWCSDWSPPCFAWSGLTKPKMMILVTPVSTSQKVVLVQFKRRVPQIFIVQTQSIKTHLPTRWATDLVLQNLCRKLNYNRSISTMISWTSTSPKFGHAFSLNVFFLRKWNDLTFNNDLTQT